MNLRVLICGAVGGLLSTLALSLPLYLVLPTRYSDRWAEGFPSSLAWGVLGYLLAIGACIGTGYCAARWSWAASLRERIKSGALAGLIVSMIAYTLIGAAAASVAANGWVYQNGLHPAGSDAAAVHIVAETVARAGWYPYLTFWAMLLTSIALGGLGAWIGHHFETAPWGIGPPAPVEEPIDASIAMLIVTVLTLVVCLAAIDVLATNAENKATEYGFELSLPPRGIIDWPVGMCLLICAITTWLCGRWCASHHGHPVKGIRRTVLIAAIAIIAAPFLTILAMFYIKPNWYHDPVIALGVLVWLAVLAIQTTRIARAKWPQSEADAPRPPSFRDRLLINAGLVGTIYPALVMVTGVSSAVSLALGVVVFLAVLFGKTEPQDILPSIEGSMQQMYVVHFLYSLYGAAFWMVLALTHAALVLGWQAFWRRRARASLPPSPLPEAAGTGEKLLAQGE